MPFVFENTEPKKRFVFEEPEKKRTVVNLREAARTLENIGQVYPALETAANLATMSYGLPAAGLAGLAGLPFGKGEEWQNATAKALIYEPQTERGKELTQSTFYPFEKLEEVGEIAGTATMEKTGIPELGATVKTAIQALPLALPLAKRAGKGLGRIKAEPLTPAEMLKSPETKYLKGEFEKRFVLEEPKAAELQGGKRTAPGRTTPERFVLEEQNAESIPAFKSTNDAVKFGETATPEQVSRMAELRKAEGIKTEAAMKAEDYENGMISATNGQFYREAIEASKGEHPSQIKPREPEPTPKAKEPLTPPEDVGKISPMTSKQGPGDITTKKTSESPMGGNPFKDSVVQEPVYHSTVIKEGSRDFDIWSIESPDKRRGEHDLVEPGVHFGTESAATTRLYKVSKDLGKWESEWNFDPKKHNRRIAGSRPYSYYTEGGVVKEVYLDARNPIRLPDDSKLADGYGWSWRGILRKLVEKKRLPKTEAIYTEKKSKPIVEKYFKDNGIDSIVYKNDYEGGGDSYIVFDDKQIKINRTIVRDADGKNIELPERLKILPNPSRQAGEPGKVLSPTKSVPPEVLKDYPDLKPKEGTTLYGGLPIDAITKGIEKVGSKIWDDAIMKGVPKLLEKVPGGKAVNRALIYDYRGDLPDTPGYIAGMEGTRRNRQLGRSYAIDLGQRLQTVSELDQLKLGEYIRGELSDLPGNLKPLGDEAKNTMLTLGKQAVDIGLLSEETFFKNAGRYMPRLYNSKEYQSLLTKFGLKKAERLDLSRFKQRKDIPPEIRKEMGEIMTPGYPVAKGIAQLTHDIETAKWFKGISENPNWALPKTSKGSVPEGWKQLPTNKKLGALSDSYVHPEIFQDLQQTIRVMETPEKVWRKTLGAWKFGKVILSPKTHARNLMSNSILAHLGGMPMYEQPVYLAKAARAMRAKDAYWKQAMDEGLLGTTWAEHELSSLFSEAERQINGIKAESIPEKLGRIGVVWEKSKDLANKAAKTYQAEEEWFKLAKFIHNIERKKMSPKLASADAEKWLFNYGKVTKFQEGYRSKWYGAPFATFTFKALPRIAEAAIKTPHRFLLPMAMVYGLEQAAMSYIGDTSEQAKAKKELRPEYMKGSPLGIPNFARVPIIDDYGREHYLNLTYILPWGDIGESGSFAGIPGALMPLSQPFVKEAFQQITNRDTFFDRPIVPEEELAGKSTWEQIKTKALLRGKHLGQTLLPTPALDVIKGVQSLQGKPDYRGRIRSPGVAAADALLGVKMYPVDYAEQMTRIISKKDPQKGYTARRIYGQIRVLAIKKDAAKKAGKSTSDYDDQIKTKTDQLIGLGKELKLIGETYKKIK